MPMVSAKTSNPDTFGQPAGNAGLIAAPSMPITVDNGGHPLELVVFAFILGGGYLVSLRLNPWVKCSKCQGKPKSRGWVFGHAHHFCSKCRGTGQQVRFGRKLLGMGPGKPPP
jgi:DnaJ-class molecular chaperone